MSAISLDELRRIVFENLPEVEELFLEAGYWLHKPLPENFPVYNEDDLIKYYYAKLEQHKPNRNMTAGIVLQRDREIAKRMIESRKSPSCGNSRALKQCCNLIDILFQDKTHGIQAMSMLDLDPEGHRKWILERLVKIFYQQEEIDEQRYRAGIAEEQEEDTSQIKLRVEKSIDEYDKKEKNRR